MTEFFVTFGGESLESLNKTYLEEKFQIQFQSEKQHDLSFMEPPNLSICSCQQIKHEISLDDFEVVTPMEFTCAICKDSSYDSENKIIIQSPDCGHQFHFHCIKTWLTNVQKCPFCAKSWKFKSEPKDIVVCCLDRKIHFESAKNLIENVGSEFGLNMENYRLVLNGVYVTDFKPGVYAVCTPDVHSATVMEINFIFESQTNKLLLQCTTKLSDLRKKVCHLYGLFPEEIKLIHDENEWTNAYDTYNLYNLGLKSGDKILVTKQVTIHYHLEVIDHFVVIYPKQEETGSSITDIIAGKISWIPYPFIKNTTKQDISCLLSSLYVLIKKVNQDSVKIISVVNQFAAYLRLYQIHPIQAELATNSLKYLLQLEKFSDVDRMILSCTLAELIDKMQTDSDCVVDKPLFYTNIICALIMSTEEPTKLNWKHLKQQVRLDATFKIYSPVILSTGKPPLLTFNEKLHVVVFTGKGKAVSLPIILYDPLVNTEEDVDAACLGKKIAGAGETLMVDDRIYEEAIMVCIDTSCSMSDCSDFDEDLSAMKADKIEAKKKFYEIWNTQTSDDVSNISPEDTRLLKNTLSWFVTHPNFLHWKKYPIWKAMSSIKSIICLEQRSNRNMAETMSKYRHLFCNILKNMSVTIDGTVYDQNATHISKSEPSYCRDPPTEFLCPIGMTIMESPVVADDGFSYEATNITEWLSKNKISPMTREPMTNKLVINKTLKSLINDWKGQYNLEKIENAITINLQDNTVFHYHYKSTDNYWDLAYFIYKATKMYHAQYLINGREYWYYQDDTITEIPQTINLENISETYTIKAEIGSYNISFNIPKWYDTKNIIYHCLWLDKPSYHKVAVWYGIQYNGDDVSTGYTLREYIRCAAFILDLHDGKISIRKKSYPMNKHYLSRLDVVKKLFDAFINRSLAYSFNTAIGLISFNSICSMECEITPYYESFRDHIDSLDTNGGTAIYDAIKEAGEKLTAWKMTDSEKRGQAKLRIICLSDGQDTESKITKRQVMAFFRDKDITIDTIAIGSKYDNYLVDMSKQTRGYIFNPNSIKKALNIMELETMIISNCRKINCCGLIKNTIPLINQPTKQIEAAAIPLEVAIHKVSTGRLQKELTNLLKDPHPFIDIYVNNDDVTFWKMIFQGPESTPYHGGYWLVYAEFPADYPTVPPKIRFVTPIKHCNINNYGRVCHSILDRNYTSSINMSLILQCIYGLLLNPDVTDPLDTNLAMLFYEANGTYEAEIISFVQKHATRTREQWAKILNQTI